MKRFLKIFVIPLLLTGCQSCNNNQLKQPDMNQYYAWCIVPYDNQNRTPEQRIEMLKELGLKAYAYDWREQNLDEMKQELELAQKNNINIIGIWMWIDKEDAPGNLSENNQKVFRILSELQLSTQIWVSLSDAYIGDNGDEQKLENAAEMISYLSLEAEDIGSRIGLYNHGGWFGRPEVIVSIIDSMPRLELGIIFNFHHAHNLIDNFHETAKLIRPYLWAVNLNGMKKDGPKILPIGKGDKETEMIKALNDYEYDGPFGILGHVENADVKEILETNLEGVRSIETLP